MIIMRGEPRVSEGTMILDGIEYVELAREHAHSGCRMCDLMGTPKCKEACSNAAEVSFGATCGTKSVVYKEKSWWGFMDL